MKTGKPAAGKADKLPKILIGSGLALLVIGFIVLSKANRMADNWAGFAAPFLLLAGWIVIAAGLWKQEK
ncbi:MAG: hypothetical protein JXJ19_05060 [Elusimicrobia bacterium]|nr:hypothetical protein [Elusimicrobiota bacterium]